MKQVFIPWYEWECQKNGLWRKLNKEDESIFLDKAIEFTGNHVEYGNAMLDVIFLWPKTMLNSLTNPSVNKRAFLGHCAVQYKINCPEYITRLAWRELTENQRILADKIAQEIIDEWKKEYENILNFGNQDAIRKEYQMKYQLK